MHDLTGKFTYDDFFRKTHAPLYFNRFFISLQMVVLDVAAFVPKNRPQYLLVAPLAFGLVVIEEMYPPGICDEVNFNELLLFRLVLNV